MKYQSFSTAEGDLSFQLSILNLAKRKTTEQHPFFIEKKGWVLAKDLVVGDKVVRYNESKESIQEIRVERLEEETTVYNFEVEGYHTYFVGKQSIWVHNDGFDDIKKIILEKIIDSAGKLNKKEIDDLAKAIKDGETFTESEVKAIKEAIDGLGNSKLSKYYDEVVSGAGKLIPDIIPNQGFASFTKLKKYLGDPGDGKVWHHIVEQSQVGKRAGFAVDEVNNVKNIISISHGSGTVHSKISGHYSSKFDFTEGLTVRDWLANQSFEEQFKYGKELLEDYGEVIATEAGWVFKAFE